MKIIASSVRRRRDGCFEEAEGRGESESSLNIIVALREKVGLLQRKFLAVLGLR